MTEAGYCPKCGTARPPGARFCGTCGQSFEAERPAPRQRLEDRPTRSRGGFGGSAANAAGNAMGFGAGCVIFIILALVLLTFLVGRH